MLLLLLACRAPTDPVEPLHLEPVDGNPLVPRSPLYPWPSDLYLVDDATTRTGRRLVIPDDVLPLDVPAEVFATDDGFTRAPAILAWLEGGVDPASLPSIAGSIEPDSAVLLLREGSVAPVPLLAEIDANVIDSNVQALIIRPQVPLDEAAGYVVVLRDRLRSLDGGTHEAEAAFRALRDGQLTDDPTVESMRPGFAMVNAAIEAQGLTPSEVVLAWSFHTRSETQVVSPAMHMQDIAGTVDLAPWVPLDDVSDGANRLVTGTFLAPDFLGSDGVVTLDEEGPVVKGERLVEFLITIPDTIDEPRPVVLFGHGFFSSKEEPTWSSLQQSLQPWRYSAATVDFLGFNEDDLFSTVGALTGDLAALTSIADQQLQSHVHFTLLARLVREQLAAEIQIDRGAGAFLPLDGARMPYMGISNGGTQGSVIVTTSPVLDRGALIVPGGAWSHMLQRAVQWTSMGSIIEQKYTDALELQIVLAMTQQVLDRVDIVNYAAYAGAAPFEGRSPKQLQLHMAVGDSQVANLVTEWVARGLHAPLVVPSPREVPLLDTIDLDPLGSSGLSGALFVYDEGYPAEIEDNVPPVLDNGAHGTIRDLLSYRDQVGAFLEDGTFLQVCEGPCDPD